MHFYRAGVHFVLKFKLMACCCYYLLIVFYNNLSSKYTPHSLVPHFLV